MSDLSPQSEAACLPHAPPPHPPKHTHTAVGNKELAGTLMDEAGEEGLWAVKFPLPFRRGPRGALGLGEAGRSHLGVGGSSWSLPSRC